MSDRGYQLHAWLITTHILTSQSRKLGIESDRVKLHAIQVVPLKLELVEHWSLHSWLDDSLLNEL